MTFSYLEFISLFSLMRYLRNRRTQLLAAKSVGQDFPSAYIRPLWAISTRLDSTASCNPSIRSSHMTSPAAICKGFVTASLLKSYGHQIKSLCFITQLSLHAILHKLKIPWQDALIYVKFSPFFTGYAYVWVAALESHENQCQTQSSHQAVQRQRRL